MEELFGSDTDALMMLVWIIPIILFVFYGQRIQLYVTSNQIKKDVAKLLKYRDESEGALAEFAGGPGGMSGLLDYFTIMPVDMDPAGIVPKLRHIVRSREDLTRARVKSMHPGADELEISRMLTLLEIASVLRLLHKTVNHLYLTAKRQNNFPLILPLQMALPFVMEQAEAFRDAVPAFRAGQPVGDGIGPMVVGRMMLGAAKNEAAFQTVWAEAKSEGRWLYLLKARGPESTVGRLGEAAKSIIEQRRPDAVIMVDAALMMEGEESASVARGFGAAIGGLGIERFEIEEAAAAAGIPVYSIIVRQSAKEAVGLMPKSVAEAADGVRVQLLEMIRDSTTEGEAVLVIGVGNTAGISQ
ncbi:uncharacterized protein conserved in archaea [Cenarchaeum symbiosum A]|uniref:Uncharacterized protein conserved in archaea n=1 Tax=Cenarchaeum symbiosum (strain A) TaxID=414004 RepID=A0RWY9_CENSY|nr:uncharacterized protein conserved in archaea [Cenarchaeum symbiosum A]